MYMVPILTRDHPLLTGTPPSPLPLNPTDIVEFLKALIFHPMHIEHPNVFDGSTTQMVIAPIYIINSSLYKDCHMRLIPRSSSNLIESVMNIG